MTLTRTRRIPALLVVLAACSQSQTNPDATVGASGTTAATAVEAAAHQGGSAPAQPSSASAGTQTQPVTAVVYKDANCGCCTKWVDHMREAGFNVVARDVTDLDAVKRRHDIHSSLHSCHTAEIDGYVVEGHVPADLIQKMLRERPNIAGLAVPGMPVGSPGMEWTYSEPYDVIAFARGGSTSVYAKR